VVSVEMDRTMFAAKVTTAHLVAHHMYLQLCESVSTLGEQYAQAHGSYAATLEAADRRATLGERMLFKTVIALAAGAGLNGLTEGLAWGKLMVDGAKDLAKLGVKTATDGIDFSRPVFEPISMDPATMESDLRQRANAEMVAVLGVIIGWSQKASSEDPSFALDFEPDRAVRDMLTVSGQTLDAVAQQITGAASRDELEQAMWAAWLEKNAYELVYDAGDPERMVGDRWSARSTVNGPIVDRLRELMPEAADRFLRQHSEIARRRCEEEAARRNEELQ
jgi:hypothetical protein